jgi:glycosyltransferase involved in cell wall biosynthesis
MFMNNFPGNKRFAFSIFDDTDLSTVENTAPIYRLLTDLGIRTTKSVWPLASVAEGKYGGCSLQDPEYLRFVLELRDLGFEIAIHNMRNHHCSRDLVEKGFSEFRRLVGGYPRVHANHSRNRENLYWGAARFHFLKPLYSVASSFMGERQFEGHRSESELFWGDLCQQHIDYVRSFVFREINLDRINPTLPYHDPAKPFVKYWFSSCDGSDVDSFCELLAEANQDKLEREGGVCLVYTHFACGFVKDGVVNSRAERLLRALASRDGWFVPVSQILDHLRTQRQTEHIPNAELITMEGRWAYDTLCSTMTRRLRRLKEEPSTRSRWSPLPLTSLKARLVHITSAHSPLDTRIFYKECRSLAAAGYDVAVLGAHSLDETRDGVVLRGVGRSQGRAHRMTGKLMTLGREAFRLNADVYHIHDPELLSVALLLRMAGRRVIYDIHEDLPRTILYKTYIPSALRKPVMWMVERIENFAARFMTGLVAATPTINRRFSSVNRSSVVVSNFPLRDEIRPATVDWTERKMAVAYIGGISEKRGIREIVRAVDLLPASLGARLELAGHFGSRRLETELAATPQWEHVDWRGTLDRNGIARLLSSVRAGLVVLHPEQNFVASQPIKLFEYMSAGIPVIASDFPLWRSIIEENGCGILVDPFDPQAIARAIQLLLTDSALAEDMGRRGRKAVEERFNWSSEEQALLSFYATLLSSAEMPTRNAVALGLPEGTR